MTPTFHHLSNMNHWAILVSAVILWAMGAVWYSPVLFAKPWMAALNISPDHPKDGLVIGMISSFLGDFLVSFILLHIVMWSGASTWGMGMFVGFIAWLGFFAAIQFPQGVYENRPVKLFVINGGYWLLGLLIVGAVLAVWR